MLIVRDGRSFVPDDTTRLMRGDQALLVSARRSRPEAERRLRAVSRAGRLASWRGETGRGDRARLEAAQRGPALGMRGRRARRRRPRVRSAPCGSSSAPPPPRRRGCSSLPWDQPLAEWDPSLLLEVPQRGISRHVVRFVATGGHVFALKEINERLARHEYRLLAEFEEEGLPTVSVLGICVDRPGDQEAILVTRYLEYSMSYRWLFSSPRGAHSADQLLDTMVELLVRLHLAGIFWGDCSLSNTLFRLDAGALAAYLVDAETVERHPTLSPGQRAYDVDLARERVGAELLDLQFGGLLPDGIDPIEVAESLPPRYEALWDEVTHEQVFSLDEQQCRRRRAAPAAQRPGVRRRRGGADHLRRRARGCASRPGSPSPASTAGSCSG